MFWLPYHPSVWPIVQITVIIGHSNPSLCIFAIWQVTGWQWSIRRPPSPKDNDRKEVDKHRDDDDDDNDDEHREAMETITGESDRADCYLALGGRNDHRREQQGWLLPGTVCQHNNSVCGGSDGVVANGGRVDFCGRSQRVPSENGRSGDGDGWASGHLRTLTPTTKNVELISDTVWCGESEEVDEVPDGLYSMFRSYDLTERVCMVMVCLGICLPEWSIILPMSLDTPPSLFALTSDKDTVEQYFCWV